MSVYYNQEYRYIHVTGNPEGLKQAFRDAAEFVSGTDVEYLHRAADSVSGWSIHGDGTTRSERSIPATVAIRAMSIVGANPVPRGNGDITFDNLPAGAVHAQAPEDPTPPAPEDEDDVVVDDDTSDDEIEQPPPPPPPPGAGFVFPG